MNEMIIQNYINQAEEFLRLNHQQLSRNELEQITEIDENLTDELARFQLREDLHA